MTGIFTAVGIVGGRADMMPQSRDTVNGKMHYCGVFVDDPSGAKYTLPDGTERRARIELSLVFDFKNPAQSTTFSYLRPGRRIFFSGRLRTRPRWREVAETRETGVKPWMTIQSFTKEGQERSLEIFPNYTIDLQEVRITEASLTDSASRFCEALVEAKVIDTVTAASYVEKISETLRGRSQKPTQPTDDLFDIGTPPKK